MTSCPFIDIRFVQTCQLPTLGFSRPYFSCLLVYAGKGGLWLGLRQGGPDIPGCRSVSVSDESIWGQHVTCQHSASVPSVLSSVTTVPRQVSKHWLLYSQVSLPNSSRASIPMMTGSWTCQRSRLSPGAPRPQASASCHAYRPLASTSSFLSVLWSNFAGTRYDPAMCNGPGVIPSLRSTFLVGCVVTLSRLRGRDAACALRGRDLDQDLNEEDVKEAFQVLDTDNSRCISARY